MANSPGRAVVDVGSVIADTYTLEALLGRGGMGAVFLASHNRLAGKQVAIKILHVEIDDADIVARFKREAEIAAKLNHPNIVGVIDYNVAPDGMPYLVLDYLQGETLAQLIARGPVPLDQMVSIVRQIGSALAAAHRAGIVHRDLKPQNIFLVPTEVDGRMVEIAKVLDFGISKIRGSQTVKTQDSALLGTPQYMAPEQATGQHALVDERTDEFAFGSIVYEMLSGQPAFSGASIPEVVYKVVYEQPVPLGRLAPGADPAMIAAVERAMAKLSDDRFPNVVAFVEAITGQPLTVTRGQSLAPVLAAAATTGDSTHASRRVATREAFAQTMGSAAGGDVVPVGPMLATMPPVHASQPGTSIGSSVGPSVGPIAQGTANARIPASTASGPYPGAPAGFGAPMPTVDLRGAPPRRRPIAAIAAIAIVAASAVAAGAVYVATRKPPPDPTQQARIDDPAQHQGTAPPAVDPKATDPKATDPKAARHTDPLAPDPGTAKPPDTTAGDMKAADPKAADPKAADPKAADPKAADPKAADPKAGKSKVHEPHPPAVPHTPASAGQDSGGDPEIADKLQQAQTAIDHHDYDQAERLATTVINSTAGPRQRASARLIHGLVQCEARNDQEAAQIDLRAVQGFSAMHTRLVAACRAHGIITQ
ncbi:MAG TPA: protein kinase [Kofleriaceae bacterium]|nr:protein kinase [Kofleriaceae bacterium]